MVVNVICDLAEQDAFVLQDAISLPHKGGIGVSKRISMLLRCALAKTESLVEIL